MEKTLIRDFDVSSSLRAAKPAAVEQCFLSTRERTVKKDHLRLAHVSAVWRLACDVLCFIVFFLSK